MQHEKYDFDLNGNRKQAEIQGQKQSYKTGEYNRLLSDENYSYEYDLEGNRISKTDKDGKTTKYFWDNRNRLIKVQTPTKTIEYTYDYLNRLVKRTQDKDEIYYVHDNWQIILQFDNKNLKPTHRYLWGTKQDELICDNENWTLGDHLNTIRDIVKSDGAVDHLDYNSFGKIISETKNILSFAYTGKLFDPINDLQWNINRWYDSNVGRWMSEDPIGFAGKDVNLVRYVGNKVNLYQDILGLKLEATGVKYCAGWQKGAILLGGIISNHWFLVADGVGFGKFEVGLNSIGTGEIRFNDLELYPNVPPDNLVNGEYYSVCHDVLLDSDCYDLNTFKSFVNSFAHFPAGTYVVVGANCRDWALSALNYGIQNSKSRKPGYSSFCKCTITYMQENTGYVETTKNGVMSVTTGTVLSDVPIYWLFE
jgi:RHS repeat-associated protein